MLKIGTNQLNTLRLAKFESFELRTMTRLRRHFENYRVLSDVELLALIRHGMRRAQEHGFMTAHEISKYIGLVAAFGADFDRSEALPWATELLADSKANPSVKLARLYERGIREANK